MANTVDEQVQTMINNLPEKTGKALEEWLKLVAITGLEKHGQIVKMLKGEHGVTHGYANLIASKALESGEEQDLVDAQYSGPKADLRPIYKAIVAFAGTLGSEMEIAPKKASVSLRRKKQFALVVPATKTRIDLGLALKGDDPTDRLESWNAMCSHRVRISSFEDFDDQVKAWMTEAWNRSA